MIILNQIEERKVVGPYRIMERIHYRKTPGVNRWVIYMGYISKKDCRTIKEVKAWLKKQGHPWEAA